MIPLKRQSSRRKLPFAAQKREKMMWTGHTTWKINRSIFFFPSFPHSDFYVLFLFASPKKRFSRIGGDFRMFCHWNAECLSVSWKEPKDETWILILERLPFQIAWPNFFFRREKELMRHHNNISSTGKIFAQLTSSYVDFLRWKMPEKLWIWCSYVL